MTEVALTFEGPPAAGSGEKRPPRGLRQLLRDRPRWRRTAVAVIGGVALANLTLRLLTASI